MNWLIAATFAITIALALSACSSSSTTAGKATQDTVTLSDGLRYIVQSEGSGDTVLAGMSLRVDYAGYLMNGKLFDTSIDSVGHAHGFNRDGAPFEPFELVLGASQVIAGWDKGIAASMRVGESRRLIIPPSLAYGPVGVQGMIPPNSTLIFDIHLISATRHDTIRTMEGLSYIELAEGSGAEVRNGMRVQVDYAGYLTNGKLFDTSIERIAQRYKFDRGGVPFTPIEFVVGRGNVISGWDLGITTGGMRVGGRRRLIIPPELAYGNYGSGSIPPHATLVFDIEVISAH